MDQLDYPDERLWSERQSWFEHCRQSYERYGARALSEQACALFIDLQAVFCVGAWATAVLLAGVIVEVQMGFHKRALSIPHSDIEWIRTQRNRLAHEKWRDPALTVEDQWHKRDVWEKRAKRAIDIAFQSFYNSTGSEPAT